MKRTPFAVYRKLRLVISWYGSTHEFYRRALNQYKEPESGRGTLVQSVDGIYHATARDFVELVNTEGASVKSKINKGILCDGDNELIIQQGDSVTISGSEFYVTAVEPVMYSDEVIAYEISIEELAEGVDAE